MLYKGVQKAGVQVHSVQDEAAIQGNFAIMKDQIRFPVMPFLNKRKFCQE